MAETKIEWSERVWNVVRGCRRVSPGCQNCYAERQAHRYSGLGMPYEGLTVLHDDGPRWTGEVRLVASKLDEPLRRRKPTTYFVNSMSDLFHFDVTDRQIAAVFGVMAACPQHTFQILTKRPEQAHAWFWWLGGEAEASHRSRVGFCLARAEELAERPVLNAYVEAVGPIAEAAGRWPLPNVWLGVSVEDQQRADERVPPLLETPAAVRFLSVEPLLEQVDLGRALRWHLVTQDGALPSKGDGIESRGGEWQRPVDWVIVGGESGPGARRCHVGWVRRVVEQCRDAGVPCFVKQLGAFAVDRNDRFQCDEPGEPDHWPASVFDSIDIEHHINGFREDHQGADCRIWLASKKGGDPAEWPADLRVRQMPARGW